MIPIRDNIPSRTVPVVNYIIIGINILVFILELNAGSYRDELFQNFGILPTRYANPDIAAQYNFIEQIIPFLTSMFLHGGWLHIIGNMWVLYIFGDNIEDYLGHIKYLLFYLTCGIISGIVHLLTNWHSQVPTIGASGAIAGVMGAYFLLYPYARVLLLVPIFFIIEVIEVPAFFFLGFWFFIQFFYGSFSLGTRVSYGGVAWWAHIGGFAIGLIIIYVLRNYRKKRYRF